MTSEQQIAELKAAYEASTQGEWEVEYDNDTGPADDGFWEWYNVGPARVPGENFGQDARFIELAHNLVPVLLEERERLREALGRIKTARTAMEGGSIAECRRIAGTALGGPDAG